MSIFNTTQKERFTQDDVRFMTPGQLVQFAGFTPGMSTPRDSEVMDFIRSKNLMGGLFFSERTLLLGLSRRSIKMRDRAIRPDEYTKDTAVPVVFLQNEFVIEEIPAVRVASSVVPTEQPQRIGSSSIVAFIGMLLDVSAGSWVLRGNAADFEKVYKAGIDVTKTRAFALTITEALNKDAVFTSIPIGKRSGITKDLQASFLMDFVNRISLRDYLVLHSTVVYTCFTIYVQMPIGFIARDPKHRVTEPSYFSKVEAAKYMARCTPDDQAVVVNSINKAPPRLFCGRADFDVVVPPVTNILELTKVIATRVAIGSNSVAPFLFYTMKGYSGLTTKMGRRLSVICAAAMGQLKAGYPVDISVPSCGDVTMLVHSMNHCIKHCKLDWIPSDPKQTYFKIFLTHDQYTKVRECQEFVDTAPRTDLMIKVGDKETRQQVTQIHWSKQNLPTAAKKGTAVEWEVESSRFLPCSRASRWIYFGPIFGNYMFAKESKATTSTAIIENPPFSQSWAYGFGDGSDMKGILANVEAPLYGLKAVEDPNGWSFLPELITDIPKFLTPEEWYTHVRKENGRKLTSWFAPLTRYSPISNNLRQSRKGAQMASLEAMCEAGQLTEHQKEILARFDQMDQSEAEVYDLNITQTTASSAGLVVTTNSSNSSSSSSSFPLSFGGLPPLGLPQDQAEVYVPEKFDD